jgi:hypothetical protein
MAGLPDYKVDLNLPISLLDLDICCISYSEFQIGFQTLNKKVFLEA